MQHPNPSTTNLAKDVDDDDDPRPPSLWHSPLLFLLLLFLFKRLWRLPLKIFCKREKEQGKGGKEGGYIANLVWPSVTTSARRF